MIPNKLTLNEAIAIVSLIRDEIRNGDEEFTERLRKTDALAILLNLAIDKANGGK